MRAPLDVLLDSTYDQMNDRLEAIPSRFMRNYAFILMLCFMAIVGFISIPWYLLGADD